MPLPTSNNITDSQKIGIKFMRRPDLTSSKRLYIATTALLAMFNNHWGTISGMAKQFDVSRTFIYMLASTLTEMDSVLSGISVYVIIEIGGTLQYPGNFYDYESFPDKP
jgi:phage shock protein PspC (stress-responsive transcriptional regulator)